MKQYSRDTVNTMIQDLKVSNDELPSFLKGLASDGSIVEGYNDKSKGSINEPVVNQMVKPLNEIGKNVSDYFSNVAKDYSKAGQDITGGISNAATDIGAGASSLESGINSGNLNEAIGGVKSIGKGVGRAALRTVGGVAGAAFAPISEAIRPIIEPSLQKLASNPKTQELIQPLVEWVNKNPESAKDIQNVVDILTLGVGKTAEAPVKALVEKTVNTGADILQGTTENVVKNTGELLSKTKNIISKVDVKTPELFPIDAPENIKTSLNPFLTNTKAEISVPKGNGFVLKTIDKITPAEKIAVQKETNNLYSKLLDTANHFKVDRRDILSPLEIVGQNTDKALNKVNKLRQEAGKVMGSIEKVNSNTPVELKGTRLDSFINEFLGSNKKYGRTVKDTSFMEDFAKDFDKLSQNPTAKETLDFTRTWTNELENLKDGFGQFKDNKRTYTLVEGALNDIKNNTRNLIGEINPEYKKALEQYRLTSQIRDEGNRLMGKEGLAGEKIKGGALAKRAVQSSSDAGARQFYNTLKQTVGYDGLKEADIALQAMKDVGDYQGLSLLEVNKDLYNATIGKVVDSIPGGKAVSEATKFITNKVVPQEKRVKNLIKK